MNAAGCTGERLEAGAEPAKLLVMVVDDDRWVRGSVVDLLRDDGYEVAEAPNGEGAVCRLERTRQPAILVADINLGAGMNGLELAATVRKLWPTMGILLVSGDDEALTPDAARETFLAKPFSGKQLLARVAAMARVASSR
jgi:DNA-binding response OmpR family regulator